MARRLDVLAGVKALVARALPGTEVLGMDTDEFKPSSIKPGGMAIVRSGDPGIPEIDLSPPAYNYDHAITIELAAYKTDTRTAQQVTGDMATAIGTEIEGDRYLGGLCTWLDATAPTDGESDANGAAPIGWADFQIIASYTTSSPLA